ncbi:hypothetical protein EGW08_004218 [Elysia chlorotica]|uniref:Tetraspanin-33 n=1 Tax=Elysia chlorotica TaxID=188477 RepID=A0A433U2K6_ELYCH|nr:hypothetical protein EGW08_004218 [Elysia chlorotica]
MQIAVGSEASTEQLVMKGTNLMTIVWKLIVGLSAVEIAVHLGKKMPSQAHAAANPSRSRHHGNSLRRAPAALQNSITHSLRRRGKPTQDYSPINPFVKYVLFFINVAFMLLGAATASVCIYILVEKDKAVASFIEFLFDPSCICTLLGVVAFVVAFAGAYGALRENRLLLKIYHVILSIILILEIIGIILVVVFYFREEALADMGIYPEDAFEDAIVKYRDDPDMQNFIDNMQDVLSCCGASNDDEGYKGWEANRYFNCSPSNLSSEKCSVPFSCCRISEGDQINYRCGAGVLEDSASGLDTKIYTRGCLKGLKAILTDNIWLVCGTVMIIFIPQKEEKYKEELFRGSVLDECVLKRISKNDQGPLITNTNMAIILHCTRSTEPRCRQTETAASSNVAIQTHPARIKTRQTQTFGGRQFETLRNNKGWSSCSRA